MLMAIVVLGLLCKSKFRKTPFLMDRVGNITNCEHVIDIRSSTEVSSSGSSLGAGRLDSSQHDHQSSTNLRNLVSQPTSSLANGSNSRNSSLIIRRGDGSGRHRSSPLNSGLWISVELVFTACQIVAAVVVLSLSKDEHPHAPLFGWILGYAFGCAATLPLLYWRWYYCNQASESGSSQQRQESTWSSSSTALSALTNMRNSEGDGQTIDPTLRGSQIVRVPNPRLKEIVEYLKMALDCLFAVWFVVGNVWIFGWHSSFSEAPKLYSLCIVFLAISCIGYAMPFILFATICCCLPCIIAVLGFREDFNQARGATSESINSLPTYKFKTKKTSNREHNSAAGDDGVVAAGTEKEQAISAEDAVCCICLAKYANNDELRELPCSHFFHKECVDKWLKINALCPLCKGEVGESPLISVSGSNNSLQIGN